MPSDGSGNYTKPVGSTAVTGETITASTHNTPIDDIAAGLTARLMRSGAGGMTGDLPMNANSITGAADVESDTFTVNESVIFAAAVTIASDTTTDLGAEASNAVIISGTTTIESFGTADAGVTRWGRFSGALTLTYNATSLILPGAANITTAAGDTFFAQSEGSGNWRVLFYSPVSGKSVKGATPASTTDNTVPRFNGTAGEVQTSGVTISDDNDVAAIRDLTITRNAAIPGTLTLTEQTAPSTPASGKVVVYPKSDGLVYAKDDAGAERPLGGEPARMATAWVSFNGVNGSVAIKDHYNVTSITRHSDGNYTVNFATALADTNYAAFVSANRASTGTIAEYDVRLFASDASTYEAPTTSGFRFTCTRSGVGLSDAQDIMVLVFGGN